MSNSRLTFRPGFVLWVTLALTLLSPAAFAAPKYATDQAGFVPYWLALGNIPVTVDQSQGPALDLKLIPGEPDLHPSAGEKVQVGGTDYEWKPVTVTFGTPIVDIDDALGYADYAVCYLVTYLVADARTTAAFFWGSDDSGAIYVNGAEVGRFTGARACSADDSVSDSFELRPGVNTVLLKVVNEQGGFGGCARLVDPRDFVIAGLRISGSPPGAPEPTGATWPQTSTEEPAPRGSVGSELSVGHAGYDLDGAKMAIAVSRRDRIWKGIQVCSAATDQVMFTIPSDGGSIRPMGKDAQSGSYMSRVEFDTFRTPGRYYLRSEEYGIQSLPFGLSQHAFTPVARAAARAFYFQRAGQLFSATYAGQWAGPVWPGGSASLKARVYAYRIGSGVGLTGPVVDPRPHDVRGGWYDSGSDQNEYARNECLAQDSLLLAFDMNRKSFKDGDLKIPESGNGVPDIVDEARTGASLLLRLERPDGAVYDRVLHSAYAARIAEPCSGSTLCAAGALAWAGAVWKENGWDPVFAHKCIDAAERAWRYMDARPSPWPVTASHEPKNIGSFGGGYGDERGWKMLAAAALFRATGKPEYGALVEEYFAGLPDLRLGWNRLQIEACHNYALARGARQEVIAAFGRKLAGDAGALEALASPENATFAYGAGSRDGYPAASNSLVAEQAAELAWWNWKFNMGKDAAAGARAVEEYLQYLLGRNPSGWCYVTNLQAIGVEKCSQVIYHFLNRNERWLAPQPGSQDRVGCFPGFLLGGPEDSPNRFFVDPDNFPNDVQSMQPTIVMQGDFVCLVSYCAYSGEYAAEEKE